MPCYLFFAFLGLPLAILHELFWPYEGPGTESKAAGFFGMSFMLGICTAAVAVTVLVTALLLKR